MNDLLYWIWLSIMTKISFSVKYTLIKHYGNPHNIWNQYKTNKNQSFVSNTVRRKLVSGKYRLEAEQVLNKVVKEGIGILTFNDSQYPPLLKQIPDPPVVLYYLGNKVYLNNCFGMVGSRKATSYGKKCAMKISTELASKGIVISSGMARGIDTASHKGALDSKGKTVAVLGSGINVIYPPENKELYYKIIDNGIVVTEYPPDTKPLPYNFPPRNRIISGLSKGLVVIEAGKKSGSLITVDYALAQGREVFALPGNINSIQSKGTNRLIYQGATPLVSLNDIYNLYGIESKKKKAKDLDEQEKNIYDLICAECVDKDSLCAITGFKPKKVMAILLSLELKCYIKKQKEGGYIPFKLQN